MPRRMIRDGLLDSQRYWAVTVEAQRLFIHLMLLADDFGLVSLAPIFIRRRCFDDAPAQARIDKLLGQLADEDLIRIYTAGSENSPSRYAFIPRFGQQLRTMRPKHPRPPELLFADDFDSKRKFEENKHLFEKLSASRRQPADKLPPEVELEGNRKGREGEVKMGTPLPGTGTETTMSVEKWAEKLGIDRQPGEHEGAFQVRVAKAVALSKAMKTSV